MVRRLWAVVEKAVEALRRGQTATAERHMAEAATLAESVDPAERRDHLALLAISMLRQGFSRQALPLVEETIRIDERAADLGRLCGDLMHYGWALAQEGRNRQAEQAYETAVDLSVRQGRMADAAGAGTNLAVLRMSEKRFDEADKLLERSLAWLRQEPHDDNEIRTLIYRAMCWDKAGRPLQVVIGLAEQTLQRFGDRMEEGHRNMMISMLEKPLGRFFNENPAIDRGAWLREHFAALDPR